MHPLRVNSCNCGSAVERPPGEFAFPRTLLMSSGSPGSYAPTERVASTTIASDWRAVVEIDDLPHANAACPQTKPIVLHTRSLCGGMPQTRIGSEQNASWFVGPPTLRTTPNPRPLATDRDPVPPAQTACLATNAAAQGPLPMTLVVPDRRAWSGRRVGNASMPTCAPACAQR